MRALPLVPALITAAAISMELRGDDRLTLPHEDEILQLRRVE